MKSTTKTEAKRKHEARIAEATAIVQTGKCPQCGSKLVHNNSMTGWWQCEQYGSEPFRARPNEAACNFQTFTV
jgi:ribosomal protein L37AE/L43A